MTLTELSPIVGITMVNLSILEHGIGRAIHFSTLVALCKAMDYEPGDILQLEEPE